MSLARLRALVIQVIQSGVIERKTLERYRARLWAAVMRLYNGGRDAAFMATFIRSIDEQLTEAWNKGAEDCGVAPDEMTPDDMVILEAIINNETEFINGLADSIQEDVDAGMMPDKFESKYRARVDLWANRYTETVNRAHMRFGSKQRLIWLEGDTKEKCEICPRLAGIVAFGYEWEEARFHPQMPPNPTLSKERGGCGGWNCHCRLEPTTKRRSARALDRLLAIANRL